ncbi:MAG TPA: Os1348 family NHLP clan protein, partial [Anaerolineales bacterium]|nr:Os1348 family NHLP clan protein [Anaerolineales bacterium]
MTMEIVAQILGRALLDEAFRGQLLNAPDQILEGFDLSVQEVEALKQLNADQFQQLNEAFQVHLDGAKADLAQASNFLKIEGIDGSITLDHKDWYLKKGSVEEGANFENAWSSKVVPSGSAAGSGLSLPVMLAIGAVVVGAITAGIFFFRGNTTIKQADTDFQSVSEATMAPDDEASPIFQLAVLESGPDSICLNGESLHLCAVPAGQAVELLGDSSEDPLMLPLTPEQAALLISASGGSPAGVTGFTVMMLAGPDTYQIKLPDSVTGNEAIFLSDVEGNLYFGSAAYFPDETATKDAEAADVPGNTSLAALAGTWETVPSAGTMTCEGSSMNISPEPPIQVVFDENGKAEFFE